MKYDKGSFIVVPNKTHLEGKNPITQAVFMWVCSYANEYGECWPSRSRLANDASISLPSVDKAINELCELGLLTKHLRPIENNRNLPNLYHINVLDRVGQGGLPTGPTTEATLGQGGLQELNPLLTKSNELIERVYVSEKEPKTKADTSYIAVLKIFPAFSPNWVKNRTYIDASKTLLEDQSLEDIKNAVEYAKKIAKQDYAPQIITPQDLLAKWPKLEAHFKKYA